MSEPPAINLESRDNAVTWRGSRGRPALAMGTAQLAFMASIAATLAWRVLTDAHNGTPLYSRVFGLGVPLVFAAMAFWLAGQALKTLFHFAFADAPGVSLTPVGLLAPATVAGPIPWAAIANARVFRGRFSTTLLVDLQPGNGIRTRSWPL